MPRQYQPLAAKAAKVVPYLIILLAFWLQMRYLLELQESFPAKFGQQPFCGVDAKAHVERSFGLLDGSIPGDVPYYFIPLYPLYLAVLEIFWDGYSLLLPVYLQALLQLAGIAALYDMGRMLFSRLTGALAALGLATYSYYLFYLPCFDQTLLTIPFLTLALFFVLKFHRAQNTGSLVLAGICLAAATLSRPTILLIYPVVIIWLLTNYQLPIKKTLYSFAKQVVLLVLPLLILVTPITWHNYRVAGQFILISDNFDVNLFTGNNPDATGLDSLAHVLSQPAVLRFEEINRQVVAGQTTLTAEVIRYITTQPGDWLALTAKKTWLWFGESDEPLVSPYFPLMVSQSNMLASLPVEWRAVVIAALLGLVLVPTRTRKQMLLLGLVYGVFSVATIAFFIQLRFRLPFAPFVLLLAAALLASAPGWSRRRAKRFWLALGVMLILYPFVPSLWLFIVLFVGPGLIHNFQFTIFNSQFSTRRLAVGVGLYLAIVGLGLKANAPDTGQPIDHYLGPPLAGKGILGQTFQMDCDGLNQLEVTLGVFGPQHNQPVIFHLATDPSAQEILYTQTFEGSLVRDYQRKSFSFPPIANSAGQTYFFFFASPESSPQNAITVRGYTNTPVDRYPAGSAFAGQIGALQPVEADFAFTAYCKQSLWQKLWRGRSSG